MTGLTTVAASASLSLGLAELCDQPVLTAAFASVARTDGAPGVDGVRVSAFGERLDERLGELRDCVLGGRYRAAPLLALKIPKDRDRRGRELLVPTVADRILQRALHDLMMPSVEQRMLPCVYAYRPGRSVRTAVEAVRVGLRHRPWLADLDIFEFFAAVSHDRLLSAVSSVITDEQVVDVVGSWLRAPALRGGRVVARDQGLPIGSPLSPLLANLVLEPLDHACWSAETTYVRFADDIVVCCADEARARAEYERCAPILRQLNLRLNETKSRVLDARRESVVFLGHLIRSPSSSGPERQERPRRRTLHLVEPGSRLSTLRGRLTVTRNGYELLSVPARRVHDVVVLAPVDISSAAVTACLEHGIDISWVAPHGRWWGSLRTWQSTAPELRRIQAEVSLNAAQCARIARGLLQAKAYNQKRLLQRQRARREPDAALDRAIAEIEIHEPTPAAARDRAGMMGAEGRISRSFFAGFARLVDGSFGFSGRVRRPPTDPVNSLLSFGYVLLTQEMAGACWRAGFDADIGLLHAPRSGRPSLALDLVEEFRSVIVDSLALSVLHRRVLRAEHFQHDPGTGGVRLSDEGRRVFLREYELRMLTLFTHEASGERVSYRRALVLQAEQLARTLRHPGLSYLPTRMT